MSTLKAFFHRHALRFYDPAQEQLQHALQTTLSATIAITLALTFHWPESPWLVLSSIFIMQIKPTPNLTQKTLLQAATGIIASLMTLIAWQTKKILLLKMTVISLAGFLMVIAGTAGQQFATAGLFVVVWTILAYGTNTIHPYQRAILLLAGTSLAIIIGLIPLTHMQYKLRNTKTNFWHSCHHYWLERISAKPNPLYCHSYRFHLLNCLDKLNKSLPADVAQDYAFCFELMCDVLIHRDSLLAEHNKIFHVDINNACHLITELLLPTFIPQRYLNLTHAIHHIQHQFAHRHQISDSAKQQLDSWLQSIDALALQICEVRQNASR